MELKNLKTVVIIQARSTSKRFPNKVLEKVKGLTPIQILINRIKFKKIDRIIVAIPKIKKKKLKII